MVHSLKQLELHPMASSPSKEETVILWNDSYVSSLSFLHYNYLKALSRLHQLKLLGHTLVVEFAKEQDSAQVLSQPSVSEKCKRYVHNNLVSVFVILEWKFHIHYVYVVLLRPRVKCNHLEVLAGRFRSINKLLPPINIPFNIIMK